MQWPDRLMLAFIVAVFLGSMAGAIVAFVRQ